MNAWGGLYVFLLTVAVKGQAGSWLTARATGFRKGGELRQGSYARPWQAGGRSRVGHACIFLAEHVHFSIGQSRIFQVN